MEKNFEHKSLQKLFQLYMEHKNTLGKGMGVMGMMWRSLAPSIPDVLEILDEDEEVYRKIKSFLLSITETMKEEKPLEG